MRGWAKWAVVALALAGCATPAPKQEIVFFPPVPELPRIQFLASFSGPKGFEEESAFRRFIVGVEEPQRLDKPYGVAVTAGRVYVCDTNQTVFVFDLEHKTFRPLAGATGQGKLVQPINISIAPEGLKYVSDTLRGQVVVFGADDGYLRAFGRPEEWKPVDAVPLGEKLYVADIAHGRVVVLDRRSGEQVGVIGAEGEPAARLNLPTNLAFDRNGTLYVADAGRFQVVKYDASGAYVGTVGKLGNNLGHFARPRGLSLDRDGRLYAVDASFANVQIFDPQGRLLLAFGKGGQGAGEFLLPAKVAVDYDNVAFFRRYVQEGFDVEYLIFVTGQLGDRLVNVFGFGRQKGVTYPADELLLDQVRKAAESRKSGAPKVDATDVEPPPGGAAPPSPPGTPPAQ